METVLRLKPSITLNSIPSRSQPRLNAISLGFLRNRFDQTLRLNHLRSHNPIRRNTIARSELAVPGAPELQLSSRVRGICFYAVSTVIAIPLFVSMIVAHPFVLMLDRHRRRFHHLIACAWAAAAVVPFYRFQFEGLENLPARDGAAVYVSNHQSFLDIYTLLMLGRCFKFISKRGIFVIPVVGWAMFLMGLIPLRRMDSRSQLPIGEETDPNPIVRADPNDDTLAMQVACSSTNPGPFICMGPFNEDSYHSIPSHDSNAAELEVSSALPRRREGKAHEFEFQPFTTDGVRITKDFDYADPSVMEGFLNCMMLPEHQDYYTSIPNDRESLMQMGLKEGLIHFLKAKQAGDASSARAAAEEVRDLEGEFCAKDYISTLECKLAETEEAPCAALAEKPRVINTVHANIDFLTFQSSHSRATQLESDLAKLKQESKGTILSLQREHKSIVDDLAESRVVGAALANENEDLRTKLKKFQDDCTLLKRRYIGLVHILVVDRTLYDEVCKTVNDCGTQVASYARRLRTFEATVARNAILEQEVSALQDRLLKIFESLAKVIAESKRVEPTPEGIDVDDPSNLCLHAWQADEALLCQTLADKENALPGLMAEKFVELEDACNARIFEECRTAYWQGREDGYYDRFVNIFNEINFTDLNREINKFLEEMIATLSRDNSNLCERLLGEFRKALDDATLAGTIRIFVRDCWGSFAKRLMMPGRVSELLFSRPVVVLTSRGFIFLL